MAATVQHSPFSLQQVSHRTERSSLCTPGVVNMILNPKLLPPSIYECLYELLPVALDKNRLLNALNVNVNIANQLELMMTLSHLWRKNTSIT